MRPCWRQFSPILRPSFLVPLAATAAVVGMHAKPAYAVTTWNWSFTTLNTDGNGPGDQFGSGTFTTADVTPTANTTYTITGISGTYSRGGTTYTITGLGNRGGADNTFRWDGTQSSPIIATNNGISFFVDSSPAYQVNLYATSGAGYRPIFFQGTGFSGADGNIASSQLSPVYPAPGPSDVPGPLPLFGAVAAFQASRRLRRRLSTSAAKS